MFCAVNSLLRRQRRRAMALVLVLALAGAVVTAHSVMSHDHVGDAVVICLAVAETGIVAIGAKLAATVNSRRPLWLLPEAPVVQVARVISAFPGLSRAGPLQLQVLRL